MACPTLVQEKKERAFKKMQEHEEKRQLKEAAKAAGPKPRGRPRKQVAPASPKSEVEVGNLKDDAMAGGKGDEAADAASSTACEKGSPEVKAPLKKRRLKASAGASTAEATIQQSAGSKRAHRRKQREAKEASKPAADGGAAVTERKGGPNVNVEAKIEKKDPAPDAVPKEPSAAEQKRIQKAKLGLQKLAENLNSQDCRDIGLPGPGFSNKCWTALPEVLGQQSKIRVILYQESFYVTQATVPDFMIPLVHAPRPCKHICDSSMLHCNTHEDMWMC